MIIPVDLELLITDWLRPQLLARAEPYAHAAVIGRGVALNPRPDWSVAVAEQASDRLDVARQSSTVGFNIWGLRYQDTANLARLTAGLVDGLPGQWPVQKINGPRGPYDVGDQSQQPRLFMSFVIIHHLIEQA